MPGPATRCPECGSTLHVVEGSTKSRLPVGFLIGIVVAVAAAIAIAWFGFGPTRKPTAPVVASAPAAVVPPVPVAAPPAPAPVAAAAEVAQPPPAPVPPPPAPPIETYLTLAGSNTIGSNLGPDLVKAWLVSKHAGAVHSARRSVEDEAEVDASIDGRPIRVLVRAHGSATAFTDLAEGTADIGMASRPIKDTEAGALAALGDMKRAASEHVIGLDGVAVIVPVANPIAKLSRADLRRIFSGEASTWSVFGGANRVIKLYARDSKSGTYDTFADLVLKGVPLGAATRLEDSAELEAAVARDPDAIGFVGLPYVKATRAVPVSDGPAAALEPTRFSIKTEEYPLSRRLFLYTAAMPSNPSVRDFVAFALSDAGQAIVRAAKFVDLDLSQPAKAEPTKLAAACRLSTRWTGDPQAYCRLREGAEQLGTSFRFQAGSADLDNRATQDLRRLLDVMERSPARKIVLAGFSDSSGSYASNCSLSQARGRAVAAALETLGLKGIETIGFCDELPVRDNTTPDGRELNRRVDLFLR